MITEQQIRSVLNQPVHDAQGEKIGKVDHLYLDDATGRPEWVSLKTGWFGSSESFVPIADAHVVDGHLEVPFAKGKVKDAPNVDVDSGGHLSAQEEHRLYEYYGIAWDDAWQAANRPGEGGWAHSDGGTGLAAGTAGLAGTAGAAGTADTAGMTGTTGTGAAGTADEDAMVRSEERMHVGVERYESGHARLRKYVVTEEVQQTVPVRHEEVRVEREPITEAEAGRAVSGEPISEAEHEVVLHDERPVVSTEAVPVERVRLVTDEQVEERTVTGEVRKERIEAELPDTDRDDRS
ncbi:DUF2382 domain-containing protein [Kitasatospora sp. NPDC088391]|uniref:DUF2382 domain-containing protein n=1 Tax=Kitasatospora sp. NPDC088391 TaxID=3364074 RepID=UPI0038029877